MGKDHAANGARQSALLSPGVNFRNKRGDGLSPGFGHGFQCIPEIIFQRNTGAVPGDGQRALFRLVCHKNTLVSRADHVLGPHDTVEINLAHISKPQRFLAQRRAVLVGGLGDFGGLVIPNFRSQRRHQHE